MAQQKAQFRDAVKQFAIEVDGCDISALSEIRRSDALTLAYIQKIFNHRNPGLFPTEIEDLRMNIVDGAGDRGADFIFRSDTQVYIIQSKYRKADSTESEQDFDHFRSVLKRLCPDTGEKQKKNQKVLDLIADIDWEADSFSLYYISLAKQSQKIELSAEGGVDNVPNSALKDINDRCALEYLSEVELNEQYREVLRSSSGDIPTVEIMLSAITADDDIRLLEPILKVIESVESVVIL